MCSAVNRAKGRVWTRALMGGGLAQATEHAGSWVVKEGFLEEGVDLGLHSGQNRDR